MTKLESLNQHFVADCEPDLIIYLDIDPKLGLQRAKKVGDPDRIEQAGLDFFDRARKTFKELVNKSSNAVEIDANQSIQQIEKEIYHTLEQYI
jgi:dTMP kinase